MQFHELCIAAAVYDEVRRHLLRPDSDCEEAAFLFCREEEEVTQMTLRVFDIRLLTPDDFASRSAWYLELTDEARVTLIKQAHDLDAALVECHSHPQQDYAEFSPSDLSGFREFVPHVRWRLKGRSYAAVVFTPQGFDALAWSGQGTSPLPLAAIRCGEQILKPTGATLDYLEGRTGSMNALTATFVSSGLPANNGCNSPPSPWLAMADLVRTSSSSSHL